jgi:predicted enzyme related to lactoylglutathione lyase
MTNTFRKPGEFCWMNMLSPDPDKARAFFGAVLGWEFYDIPGMGHGIRAGGRNIGGLFNTVSPRTPNGTPAVLSVMIKVESADATAARIRAQGGTAEPAFDVGPAGRMAVCHDPNGAKFDLWEPKSLQGTDVDRGAPGAPSWFETITCDTARAGTFYEAVFGWTPNVSMATGAPYTAYDLGGSPVAGMMQLTPAMEAGGMKPDWCVYFTVTDPDDTARIATANGGKICVPPAEIPGVGRFCGIISPEGITFYAIRYSR